jgi:hypothetical protein
MKLTLETLYSGVGFIKDIENLDEILNSEPKKEWLKEHPQVKGFMYLPIERVEFLLNRLFDNIKIEIRSVISAENRAVVTVRVNYGNGMFHDGVGAAQISKTQPAEMAFPLAKSLAVKDSCDFLGKIFGKDLNRSRDVSIVTTPKTIDEDSAKFLNEVTIKVKRITNLDSLDELYLEIQHTIPKGLEKNVKAIFIKQKTELNG